MNKKIMLVAALLTGFALFGAIAQDANEAQPVSQTTQVAQNNAEASPAEKTDSSAFKYIAAALAVGLACIAGGMAVGKIGAAAMGAMSENAELSGKALPFVGLAEGICLWGFLVALLIIL
ncbi:MAG: ATPase [Treponema sp.]|nr:ATPase [Treponema sp.]